jgi:uncharacterized protein (DUF2132 family)
MEHIVTDLIDALLSNGWVNKPQQYKINCFMRSASSKSTLPGNAAVNKHPQQWDTVFSVGSVKELP